MSSDAYQWLTLFSEGSPKLRAEKYLFFEAQISRPFVWRHCFFWCPEIFFSMFDDERWAYIFLWHSCERLSVCILCSSDQIILIKWFIRNHFWVLSSTLFVHRNSLEDQNASTYIPLEWLFSLFCISKYFGFWKSNQTHFYRLILLLCPSKSHPIEVWIVPNFKHVVGAACFWMLVLLGWVVEVICLAKIHAKVETGNCEAVEQVQRLIAFSFFSWKLCRKRIFVREQHLQSSCAQCHLESLRLMICFVSLISKDFYDVSSRRFCVVNFWFSHWSPMILRMIRFESLRLMIWPLFIDLQELSGWVIFKVCVWWSGISLLTSNDFRDETS